MVAINEFGEIVQFPVVDLISSEGEEPAAGVSLEVVGIGMKVSPVPDTVIAGLRRAQLYIPRQLIGTIQRVVEIEPLPIVTSAVRAQSKAELIFRIGLATGDRLLVTYKPPPVPFFIQGLGSRFAIDVVRQLARLRARRLGAILPDQPS